MSEIYLIQYVDEDANPINQNRCLKHQEIMTSICINQKCRNRRIGCFQCLLNDNNHEAHKHDIIRYDNFFDVLTKIKTNANEKKEKILDMLQKFELSCSALIKNVSSKYQNIMLYLNDKESEFQKKCSIHDQQIILLYRDKEKKEENFFCAMCLRIYQSDPRKNCYGIDEMKMEGNEIQINLDRQKELINGLIRKLIFKVRETVNLQITQVQKILDFLNQDPSSSEAIEKIEELLQFLYEEDNVQKVQSFIQKTMKQFSNFEFYLNVYRKFTHKKEKTQAEKYLFEGQAQFNKGKYNEAIIFFNKGLGCDPLHYESLYYKGESLRKLLRLSEALQVFELALFSNSSSVKFQAAKWVCLFELGNHQECNLWLEKYINQAQNHDQDMLKKIKINLQLRLQQTNDLDIFISNWK